jgi:hypothetical protein
MAHPPNGAYLPSLWLLACNELPYLFNSGQELSGL